MTTTEEELMDIDPAVVMVINDSKTNYQNHLKRRASDSELSNNNTNPAPENLFKNAQQIQQRKILKAKRTIYDVHLVLDTNVLLEDLNALKTLVVNCKNSSNNSCQLKVNVKKLIVPWTVISELDGLKESSITRRKAMNAIRFIHEQLKHGNKEYFVCLDRNEQLKLESIVLPNENNDDRILQCCQMLSKQLQKPQTSTCSSPSSSSSSLIHPKIILITNDLNLQNKAMIHRIEAISISEFNNKYSAQKETCNKKFQFRSQQSTTSTSTNRVNIAANEGKHRNISGGSNYNFRSNVKRFKATTSSTVNCQSKPSTMPTMDMDDQNFSNSSSNNENSSLDLKYSLESRLTKFIVETCKEQYPDNTIEEILGKNYQPSNASLLTSLRIFKNHWLGLFSDYFNRDSRVINQVNNMLKSVDNRNHENYECLMKMLDLAKKPEWSMGNSNQSKIGALLKN